MDQNVAAECVFRLQEELAVVALKFLDVLCLVTNPMISEITFRLECFGTKVADKISFRRVHSIVIKEFAPSLEFLWALFAMIVLYVKVSPDVLVQNLLRTVDLATVGTDK